VHCFLVSDVDGAVLQRIGSESVTNFPNEIDISDAGKKKKTILLLVLNNLLIY